MGHCCSVLNIVESLSEAEKKRLMKGFKKGLPNNDCCKKNEITILEYYFYGSGRKKFDTYAVIQCKGCYKKYNFYPLLDSYSLVKHW